MSGVLGLGRGGDTTKASSKLGVYRRSTVTGVIYIPPATPGMKRDSIIVLGRK